MIIYISGEGGSKDKASKVGINIKIGAKGGEYLYIFNIPSNI